MIIHQFPISDGLLILSLFVFPGSTASNAQTEAENLVKHHGNARALLIDMEDRERIADLVREADVVVRCVFSSLHLYKGECSVLFIDDADRAAYFPHRSIPPSRSSVSSRTPTLSRHHTYLLR